jgi:small GTP-binding protein
MKVILVGDTGAGKTCLACYRATNAFDPTALSTSMATTLHITERVMGTPVRLEIWDTAGQEKFRALTITHFRNARAALLCYDSTRDTQSIPEWIGLVSAHAGPSCVTFLVATKSDLLPEDKGEVINAGERLSEDHQLGGFFLTSAKTGQGIASLFEMVAGQHPRFRTEMADIVIRTPAAPIEKAEKSGKCC